MVLYPNALTAAASRGVMSSSPASELGLKYFQLRSHFL